MLPRPLHPDDLPRMAGLGIFLEPPVADGFAADAPDGSLGGAIWLRERPGPEGVRLVLAGAVAPAWRGHGLGRLLLDAAEADARARAGDRSGVIRIETVDPPDDAHDLYRRHGFELGFQELEMERPTAPDPAALPPDVTAELWHEDLVPDFYAVYWDAFRERPGFPGWDAATWRRFFTGTPVFRPEYTLLLRRSGEPVASALCGVEDGRGFVIQLGVRPAARGQRLGEALLRHVMDRFAAAGLATCRLEVATNNARAMHLYTRLGFTLVRTVEVWRKPLP